MTRQVYINGRYLPYQQASVHVEDRGFQFADAVYEVCEVKSGRVVDAPRHLARLRRSLHEISIPFDMTDAALTIIMRQIVARNRVANGIVYLQVTRGVATRDFLIPQPPLTPTLVCLAKPLDMAARAEAAQRGIAVITEPDPRWARCDIKTVMLLPAVLAKQAAAKRGAQEVWFVDADGRVTEGASSNAWIVNADDTVQTRALSRAILPGITRTTTKDMLASLKLTLTEAAFTVNEAMAAREAFVTSASGTVMPVVTINGQPIGRGTPGPITKRLRAAYHEFADL
jgi:D-alanine transaminase